MDGYSWMDLYFFCVHQHVTLRLRVEKRESDGSKRTHELDRRRRYISEFQGAKQQFKAAKCL